MDIFQQQSMQNWKREIIMDPHLNALFDNASSPQTFLHQQILPLPHPQIIKIYMKMTSLKHSIAKHLQKEIEMKQGKIESAFRSNFSAKRNYDSVDHQSVQNALKSIHKFNQKYELIAQKVTVYRNLNSVLHFASALEKFKVKVRYLRSMCKQLQNKDTKVSSGLLNSTKISKILRELSELSIKFDFSGVRSFEEERVYINGIRGSFFGVIERELVQALYRLPEESSARKGVVTADITSKLAVLENIGKLKDFCVPFFKNLMKEMSELLKKCLGSGISGDETDGRNYLVIFEEYFVHSVHRKIVENSIIFIELQELFEAEGIKVGFIGNFFEKYWENLRQFIQDMIAWSIDNERKEWGKEGLRESLLEGWAVLQDKHYINKYLSSIVWKYPILYKELASIANQVHLHLIKGTKYHHYDFPLMKQQLIKELVPLAQHYYTHSQRHYEQWTTSVREVIDSPPPTDGPNYPLSVVVAVLENSKVNRQESLNNRLAVTEWLLFHLNTNQIYDFHSQHLLSVCSIHFKLFKQIIATFEENKHEKEDFAHLVAKAKEMFQNVKNILKREAEQPKDGIELASSQKGWMSADPEGLITAIRSFRQYEEWVGQNERSFSGEAGNHSQN